mgnify:CR=1 FL=1
MRITFADSSLPESGAVAAGILADGIQTPAARRLDAATGGAVTRALAAAPRFKGKPGAVLDILAPACVEESAGGGWSRVLLFGLGDPADAEARVFETVGGELTAKLNALGEEAATMLLDAGDGMAVPAAEQAARVALGARLRGYRFDTYKTREKPGDKPSLTRLCLASDAGAGAAETFAPLDALAEGVALARDLVSEPANVLTPETLAAACEDLRSLGVTVEVLGPAEIAAQGMGALLAVARGSANAPRVVTMRWNGVAAGDHPLAVVGKGVCFDSGGLSIKPAAGMGDMKWDMGGAGVTVGLMKALAARKARANVVGVVGLVENMPSANAYRPGDILTSMSGQTIEVMNTDAEGRLVLADALWYTQETFAPHTVVDLATLTGAVLVAFGPHAAGLFANDDALADGLAGAGTAEGERVWRLPLGDDWDRDLDCDIADMKNTGEGRNAGAIVAAQFLQRFIKPDVAWAHLDIAGVTWSTKDKPTVPKGGTGFGVRLLDRLVRERCEP